MQRLLCASALLGFSSVLLGAFGAHGLEGRLSTAQLDWWSTASDYAMIHALAALAIALSTSRNHFRLCGWLFMIGALIFSASLYLLALGAPSSLAFVTPAGGLILLAGWGMLAYRAITVKYS